MAAVSGGCYTSVLRHVNHSYLFFIVILAISELCSGLQCYCENNCPDNNAFNGTCHVNSNSYCFSSVELLYDSVTKEYHEFRTSGCFSPDESGLMQCRGSLIKHARPRNITCCREYDLCNENLKPTLNRHASFPDYEWVPDQSQDGDIQDLFTARLSPSFKSSELIRGISNPVLFAASLTSFLVIMGLVTLLLYRYRNSFFSPPEYNKSDGLITGANKNSVRPSETIQDMIDQSSGSGSGLPLLVQRTIAKQIQHIDIIGKGRYGEVWLGRWRGEKVAVKIFFTADEASWFRETEIYQTVLLRHDNILGFIAADIKGNGSYTQMLLITDYHDNGSLTEYLSNNTLPSPLMLKMAHSIVSGLSHLHSEIFGTRGKPAIAHRDMKSKNVLVKRNGECCIADFGLAVKYNSTNGTVDLGSAAHAQVGTRRYMAPELLDNSAKVQIFDTLKMADIYSTSLVLWELVSRCVIEHTSPDNQLSMLLPKAEYELPYSPYVSPDPSIEAMHDTVCVRGIRPTLPYSNNEAICQLSKMISECWHPVPSVRLTALRLKKSIAKIKSPHKGYHIV